MLSQRSYGCLGLLFLACFAVASYGIVVDQKDLGAKDADAEAHCHSTSGKDSTLPMLVGFATTSKTMLALLGLAFAIDMFATADARLKGSVSSRCLARITWGVVFGLTNFVVLILFLCFLVDTDCNTCCFGEGRAQMYMLWTFFSLLLPLGIILVICFGVVGGILIGIVEFLKLLWRIFAQGPQFDEKCVPV